MIDTQAIRNKILDLAIRGKLTEQLPEDGTAEELYQQIQAEKAALVKEGKIKKQKPLPEITEDEIPFDIPNNWKWVRLGEISLQITDGTHRTPKYIKQGVPFLSVKNISAGFLDLTDIKYISIEEHEELIKRCKPERDDILICRIGTLGKALRIDTDLTFSIFVSLGLIKTSSRVLSDYITMVINSGFGAKWIFANKAGGAMHADKINLTDLNMLPIPLPPISEQASLLSKTEELLGDVNELDSLRSSYIENLSVLKNKIIDAGIRGELTEQLPEDGTAEELYQQIQTEKAALIKEGKIKKQKPLPEITEDEIPFDIPLTWKWVRLEATITLQSGQDLKATEYNDEEIGIPYLTGASNFDENDNLIINRWTATPKNLAFENDVLISCKGTVGKITVLHTEQVHIARQFMAIRAYVVNVDYIKLFMESVVARIKAASKGLIPGIERRDILELPFPLPPLAEQKRIVERIEELLAAMLE